MFIWESIKQALGMVGQVIQARHEVKLAKLNAEAAIAQTRAEHEANWETAAVQQAGASWKDEWWTILLSWPIIHTFAVHYNDVHAAFAQLNDMPSWYQWAVMASISFSFGRKAIPSLFNGKTVQK